MRAFVLCAFLTALFGAGFSACNPNSIGRPCINGGGQAVRGTQVSSPALECPSRLCLLQQSSEQDAGFRATCTAECESNDDCDPETRSQCKSGFVCAVARKTGDFCCKKLCICRDDLDPNPGGNVDADGGVITPSACDPRLNPDITCSNVKRR